MKRILACILIAASLLPLTACDGLSFYIDPVGLAAGGDDLNEGEDGLPGQGVEGLRIAIDPGHGGIDNGAVGADTGVFESELNLQIAKLVAGLFRDGGADVLMTRETADVDYSGEGDTEKLKDMNNRAGLVTDHRTQILVSIHMNACDDRSVQGAQVFYQQGSAAGKELARCIQKALNSGLAGDRSISSGDYFITRVTEKPSVIVECGFLSNRDEEKRLADPEYQRKLAECICQGVCDYIEAQ